MFNIKRGALAVLILAGAPAMAAAQQATQPTAAVTLETGIWTGTVTPPNGQTADVTYEVTAKGDTIEISINAGPFGVFPAQQIKVEADKVSFTFIPGPSVQCVLNKKPEAGYEGDCLDDSGAPAHMTMLPPRKQAPSGN